MFFFLRQPVTCIINFTYDSSRFHFHFVSYVVPFLDRKRCPCTSLRHIICKCSLIIIFIYLKLTVLTSQNIFLYNFNLMSIIFQIALHFHIGSSLAQYNYYQKQKTYHPNIRNVYDASSRRRMIIVHFLWFFSCMRTPDPLVNLMLKRESSTKENFWSIRSIMNCRSDIIPIYWAQSFAGLIDQTKSHLSSNVFEIRLRRDEYHFFWILHSFHYFVL